MLFSLVLLAHIHWERQSTLTLTPTTLAELFTTLKKLQRTIQLTIVIKDTKSRFETIDTVIDATKAAAKQHN